MEFSESSEGELAFTATLLPPPEADVQIFGKPVTMPTLRSGLSRYRAERKLATAKLVN